MSRVLLGGATLAAALAGSIWFALSGAGEPAAGAAGPSSSDRIERSLARVEARLEEVERRLAALPGPRAAREEAPDAAHAAEAPGGTDAPAPDEVVRRLEEIEKKIDLLLLNSDGAPPDGDPPPVNQALVDDLVRRRLADRTLDSKLMAGWPPSWVYRRLGPPHEVGSNYWEYRSTVQEPNGPCVLQILFSKSTGRVERVWAGSQ